MNLVGSRLLRMALLALAAFGLSLALFLSGLFTTFEFKFYDLMSRNLNPARGPGDIVIVKIDQQSLDALSSENINWPWPRQMYAPLLDYLSQADGVLVDIIFTEPSSYGEEDDLLLAEALKKAGNVFLPIFLTNDNRQMGAEELAFMKSSAIPHVLSTRLIYQSALTNIENIRTAALGAGNVVMKPDADGTYRRVPLSFRFRNETIPNFVLASLLKDKKITVQEGKLSAANKPLPLLGDSLLLRFYSDPEPFTIISAADIFKSSIDSEAGRTPVIARDFFKGKRVFIGLTAAGLYDLKPTPITAVSTGVMVHATAMDNLLHRHFIRQLPSLASVILMFLLSGAICLFVLTHHKFSTNLAFFAAAAAFVLGLSGLLFKNGIYLQVIPSATALVVAMIASVAFSYATEGKERRFVRRAFAQYMDETLVDYLLQNPDLIKPGGQRRRVSVFFADIAGFTTIAERLPAEATAKILHTALNTFSEVIIRNHGVIDKYIGDCIMAFWGAPIASEDDELNACRAAVECQEALVEINRGLIADGLTEIAIRIGINSGDAIVGNLGSDRLFDFTAIGDTVNLASRLESANKYFKTRIMVSEDTFSRTGDAFISRELGLIEVKGKSQPIRIYELLVAVDRSELEVKAFAEAYGVAYRTFTGGNWQESADLFASFLESYPDDGPAAYYLKWCGDLQANPPLTNDWNVIKMTEK
ncbi:CHASE2 sensor adenylate/guanylate cyclase [Geotalea daltonii FRC-32]|uniref:CHASE2 sensor adenylate/guanylate cyclase n=1 Tax=Geotalea daltonii (strain DSM 22248 / JCM 15807 / FRC-32) TaxID=316067 RepID=B9M1U8_GEODF|nr:adenylate/guanylate cyclase domain-containing protein [Geotalea daltonii]ACM19244.1 CHASE2 sensor adenylate/guanylate cyclase [Geotalea daltonii FRC-32]